MKIASFGRRTVVRCLVSLTISMIGAAINCCTAVAPAPYAPEKPNIIFMIGDGNGSKMQLLLLYSVFATVQLAQDLSK